MAVGVGKRWWGEESMSSKGVMSREHCSRRGDSAINASMVGYMVGWTKVVVVV